MNILTPFFLPDHHARFIEMQRLTGLIITGSMAISFFTEHFKRRELVFKFLQDIGYKYERQWGQKKDLAELIDEGDGALTVQLKIWFGSGEDYQGQTIIGVLNFLQPGKQMKVQIVLTQGTPMYSVLQFHSTCVMNFIMESHAFALYPVATFLHRKSTNSYLMDRPIVIHPGIEKYTKQGFEYIRSGDEYEEMFHLYVNRQVGDKHLWTVNLDPNHSHDNDDLYHPAMANTWRLVDTTPSGGFWMDAGLMWSSVLDKSYCICSNFLPTICPDGLIQMDENVFDTIITLT
ncbi:hypothetical protein ARMGADRAFT_1037601 [Armillaria gallica]|uniref:Uncharacterized protein n=1 Tax=Armillaria gallica TaxID=47427 RepID=A0A2H3D8F8_ARMGA|nr:hypothetical protein ARMGADRAFT_1037601 [Armillaria gallica]